MLQYMLDSDTCIYLNKKHPFEVTGTIQSFCGSDLRFDHYACRALFRRGKVRASDRKSERLGTLFSGDWDILPFSKEAVSHYAQLRVDLQRLGKIIGPYDMLIGAHARAEGLTLVTNNEREFRRIPGLLVENWA